MKKVARQIDRKLADEDWFEVARFAASCCQSRRCKGPLSSDMSAGLRRSLFKKVQTATGHAQRQASDCS